MVNASFLSRYLAHSIPPGDRVTFASDVRQSYRDEQVFAYERSWLVAGAVMHTTAPDAMVVSCE